jgi:predicted transcriptional regulator
MLNPAPRTRGDLERDVMAMLTIGDHPMTLDQVRERLGKSVMYSTVMTVLSRLHQQGLARRTWVGQAFVYAAVTDETELTASRIRGLLDADGDRRTALARFVAMLSRDEEQMLVDLLKQRCGEELAGL